MGEEILTIEEVAKYLRVSERTVYDWAQKGEIPSGKIGTVWRFKRSEIEKWVNDRLSSPEAVSSGSSSVHVKSILSPDRVLFIDRFNKRDALAELAENLATAPQIKRKSDLLTEILKREELMSTAIGRGIAIPHVRLSTITDLVMSVGICHVPIADFQTIDDTPVNLLFMIAAAYNQHSYYLKTLSYFSAKLRQKELRESLLSAPTTEDAYNLLAVE